MIKAVRHIAQMSPYALADIQASAGKKPISLSQNESLRPPSPKVATAVANAMANAQLYPDPDWTQLRASLAQLHDIAAERILCGNGSMELIGAICQAYADRETSVLAPAHAYPFFRTATQLAGARFDIAPEQNEVVSVDALLAALQPDTKIVFIANPGNPTGTRLSRAELLRLREGLPSDILLVIDEAYGEFADDLGEPMFDQVARGDTVILRTFSKAYGLAGLRVGWGLFPPEIAAEIRKVMNPNNICSSGQAAAVAALADQAYMHSTCALTATLREGFAARLRQGGFDVPGSFTNFVLIRFQDRAAAARADAACRAEGVILRAQGGAGLPHCLRATVANQQELVLTADILEHWITGERA